MTALYNFAISLFQTSPQLHSVRSNLFNKDISIFQKETLLWNNRRLILPYLNFYGRIEEVAVLVMQNLSNMKQFLVAEVGFPVFNPTADLIEGML